MLEERVVVPIAAALSEKPELRDTVALVRAVVIVFVVFVVMVVFLSEDESVAAAVPLGRPILELDAVGRGEAFDSLERGRHYDRGHFAGPLIPKRNTLAR